jgi:hypothetical protein
MQNWKTTLAGLLMALAMASKTLGLEIPQPVVDGVMAIAAFFVGLLAKDA